MKNSIWNNIWVVRLVSLFIACLLFVFVRSQGSMSRQQVEETPEVASVSTTETVSNVPVTVNGDNDKLFVTGLPSTVSVKITGPKNIISQVIKDPMAVQTEDLSKLEPGNQTIRLEMVNGVEDLDYVIEPTRVLVDIGRRQTITIPIEYTVESNTIAPGYQLDSVNYQPQEVTLTGNEAIINQVHQAYFTISSQEALTEDTSGLYSIKIVDSKGGLLDVNAEYQEVRADLKISPVRDHSTSESN
ncbi:CdaR family protein [Hutsoniella sourekii]